MTIFLKPLRLIKFTLRLLGFFPIQYDDKSKIYYHQWISMPSLHSMVIAAYLTLVSITAIIGTIQLTQSTFDVDIKSLNLESASYLKSRLSYHEVPYLFTIIAIGCIMSACGDLISVLWNSKRLCSFLKDWDKFSTQYDISVTEGILKDSILQLTPLYLLAVFLFVSGAFGIPEVRI